MLHILEIIARAVLVTDVTLFKIINTHHAPFFDCFFSFASYLGNGWIIIPLFLAFVLRRTLKNKQVGIFTAAAVVLLISGLSNSVIKLLVDRPRPAAYFASLNTRATTERSPLSEVHIVGKRFVKHSFPSGHANTAFAIATLAVLILGGRFWPAFLIALLVAYSRVYMGTHFPLDTLAGAFLGSAVALAVWHALARFARPKDGT